MIKITRELKKTNTFKYYVQNDLVKVGDLFKFENWPDSIVLIISDCCGFYGALNIKDDDMSSWNLSKNSTDCVVKLKSNINSLLYGVKHLGKLEMWYSINELLEKNQLKVGDLLEGRYNQLNDIYIVKKIGDHVEMDVVGENSRIQTIFYDNLSNEAWKKADGVKLEFVN